MDCGYTYRSSTLCLNLLYLVHSKIQASLPLSRTSNNLEYFTERIKQQFLETGYDVEILEMCYMFKYKSRAGLQIKARPKNIGRLYVCSREQTKASCNELELCISLLNIVDRVLTLLICTIKEGNQNKSGSQLLSKVFTCSTLSTYMDIAQDNCKSLNAAIRAQVAE